MLLGKWSNETNGKLKKMNIVKDLSKELFIPAKSLKKFVNSAPHRYKVYKIEKRKPGQYRTIAQPSKELKFIQKYVMNKHLSTLPVHRKAMAYHVGRGIKKNALLHAENTYLLKMDFKNFFPSIKSEDLIIHITEKICKLNKEDIDDISSIFFWDKRRDGKLQLSIGAPSSPFISNTILFNFDRLVDDFCKSKSIMYTRYADDIVFTTNKKDLLFKLPEKIIQIISEIDYPRLQINKSKTLYSSKKHNRHITGLVITNSGLISLGRKKKRYIKSLIHKHKENTLDSEKLNHLKGLLSFCNDVEPDFLIRLDRKYGDGTVDGIKNQSSN